MSSLIDSVIPIIIAFSLGLLIGRVIKQPLRTLVCRSINPLIWLLLFLVGYEFSAAFTSLKVLGQVIYKALAFTLLTTGFSFICILLVQKSRRLSFSAQNSSLKKPILQCLTVLFIVVLGGLIFRLTNQVGLVFEVSSAVTVLLYLMIFVIGIEVSVLHLLDYSKLSYALITPLLVIIGSILGGIVAAFVTQTPIHSALALSTGFGWFSLSSILVADKLGATYGSIALATDLFRELFAIFLLYLLGNKYPHECIGAGGATTMDSTLPMVKQNCTADFIPVALINGFFLTLVGPFLISFFLNW